MENQIPAESNGERKSKRGGRRPGAGRKPNYLKRLGIKAITAAEILAHFSEIDLWRGLLNHKSAAIRLQTLSYLTDRRDGKPKQAIDVEGRIAHAHVAYRDPRLAALSDEELKALSAVIPKLAVASPDAPHNQIESNAALKTTPKPPSTLTDKEYAESSDTTLA